VFAFRPAIGAIIALVKANRLLSTWTQLARSHPFRPFPSAADCDKS
jgi:hypothetical protein